MFYKLNLLFRRLNLMLHDFNVVNLETIVMAATIDLPIYDLIKLHRHGEIAITNFIYYLRAPRPSQGTSFFRTFPMKENPLKYYIFILAKSYTLFRTPKAKKNLIKNILYKFWQIRVTF